MGALRNQRGIVGLVALGLIVVVVIFVIGYQVYQVRSGQKPAPDQRIHAPNWLHH